MFEDFYGIRRDTSARIWQEPDDRWTVWVGGSVYGPITFETRDAAEKFAWDQGATTITGGHK